MSLAIKITVKGANEATAALNKFKQNIPKTKQNALTDVTNVFVTTAKGYAHVITGNMKKSIIAHVDGQSGKAIVEAGVDYAVYENARGGDHAFWDKAIDTNLKNGRMMVKKRTDEGLKTAGVPIK